MDQKTSNFQILVLVGFAFITILSVFIFATSKSSNKNEDGVVIVPVTMWGTVSEKSIDDILRAITEKEKDSIDITYVKKDTKTFQQDLIEAIADGVGPDIVILPQDMILKNLNKISILPYVSYPVRNYKDNFVDAGSVFLKSDGVIALPFIIDPMIMYWNKTHFVNAGIVSPPKQWDEFSADVLKLTKKDSNFNISQSGASLGEYKNIFYAKDILSMLFLQAGVPIVIINSDDTYDGSFYNRKGNATGNLASMALSFYTDFANPTKDIYSWNKSMKASRDSFISSETSIYFGYASELSSISLKNPNLNFDISMVPQANGVEKKSVYSKVYGLAVLKSSKKQTSAFNQALKLVSTDSIITVSDITNLPPVRRDVLVKSPANQYMKVFYDSALISDTWIDPDPVLTEVIFKNMIESVISGKTNQESAIGSGEIELRKIINQTMKSK